MHRYDGWVLAAALGAATLGGGTRAAAQSDDGPPAVAVLPFANGALGAAHAELEPLRAGIAGLVLTELAANPGIRVVERENLQKLLQQQDHVAGRRVDAATAVRLGRILGVQHMIFGGFVTDGRGTVRLDARAVNVEASAVEHTESVQGTMDDLMWLVSDLAARMSRGMRLPPIPKLVRASSAGRSRRVPFEAAMLYSRALAAKDDGSDAEAVRLLQQSLAASPDYAPAQRELTKLRPHPDDR